MSLAKYPITDERNLEKLVRKMRVFLQLNQLAILVCLAETKEIIFISKGKRRLQHVSMQSFLLPEYDIKKNLSYDDKIDFGKNLLHKLDGTPPENIIILEEKNEDNCFILWGGAKGSVRYTRKVLGKQMFQHFCTLLMQRNYDRQNIELRNIYRQEKESSDEYKYLMDVQKRLTEILLQEPGIEGIINRIERHFKKPMLLFDYLRWKRIPSASDIGKQKAEAFRLSFLSDFFQKLSQNPETYSIPFRETFSRIGSDDTVVIAVLKDNNDILGVLVVFEDTEKLSQLQILALDRAAHMLTLEFLKQKMAYEVEQNLKDDFLNTMISSHVFQEKDIINMADNFGYDLTGAYLFAVLCYSNNKPLHEQPLLAEKKRMRRILSELLKINSPGAMVFFKNDDVIFLIPYRSKLPLSADCKEINELFSKIQQVIFDAIGVTAYIGVGSVATDVNQIKQSYHEARSTVEFLLQTGNQGVMLFQDLGFYQLFSEQHERKRLEAIARKQLHELITSDGSKRTYFLRTLERYFHHNGNLRSTSSDLHVHINTLRYRLNILKDIYNIDLNAEKCKFDTHFAIKTLFFLCPELF